MHDQVHINALYYYRLYYYWQDSRFIALKNVCLVLSLFFAFGVTPLIISLLVSFCALFPSVAFDDKLPNFPLVVQASLSFFFPFQTREEQKQYYKNN